MAQHADRPLSIVAVGAHLDDCYLGMGGAALKAARAGHRVTLVQAVSQYGAWPVVTGREAEIKPLLQGLADRAGVELVNLGHDYERLENGVALITQLAGVLADLKPDLLFCHHEVDTNQDHAVLGQVTPVAAMHNPCFAAGYGGPREVYRYTTGAQTLDFAPDTYLNVSAEVWDVIEILGAVDEMYYQRMGGSPVRLRVTVPEQDNRAVAVTTHGLDKLATCALYGYRSGVRYAEGFRAYPFRRAGVGLLDQL